jgi:hypothetical protein
MQNMLSKLNNMSTLLMGYKQLLDPEIILKLVLRLVEWYDAWAPIPE